MPRRRLVEKQHDQRQHEARCTSDRETHARDVARMTARPQHQRQRGDAGKQRLPFDATSFRASSHRAIALEASPRSRRPGAVRMRVTPLRGLAVPFEAEIRPANGRTRVPLRAAASVANMRASTASLSAPVHDKGTPPP